MNTLATPTWVTKEVARGFVNAIKFLANSTGPTTISMSRRAKVGNTVNARFPALRRPRWAGAPTAGSVRPDRSDLADNQKQVAFGYSQRRPRRIDNIRVRYTQPGVKRLLPRQMSLPSRRSIGTSIRRSVFWHHPQRHPDVSAGGVKLTDLAAPQDGRIAMLDPLAMMTIVHQLSLFNPQSVISKHRRDAGGTIGVEEWWQDPQRPVTRPARSRRPRRSMARTRPAPR